MDDGRQHENGKHKVDYYRGGHSTVTNWHFLVRLGNSLFGLICNIDLFEWTEVIFAVEYDGPISSKRT